MEQFMKDMESVMKHKGFDNGGNDLELEEGSSSDMEFGIVYITKQYLHAIFCHAN